MGLLATLEAFLRFSIDPRLEGIRFSRSGLFSGIKRPRAMLSLAQIERGDRTGDPSVAVESLAPTIFFVAWLYDGEFLLRSVDPISVKGRGSLVGDDVEFILLMRSGCTALPAICAILWPPGWEVDGGVEVVVDVDVDVYAGTSKSAAGKTQATHSESVQQSQTAALKRMT